MASNEIHRRRGPGVGQPLRPREELFGQPHAPSAQLDEGVGRHDVHEGRARLRARRVPGGLERGLSRLDEQVRLPTPQPLTPRGVEWKPEEDGVDRRPIVGYPNHAA